LLIQHAKDRRATLNAAPSKRRRSRKVTSYRGRDAHY
jgi:hypothetical protein